MFLDGTYLAGGCLLIASSFDHIIAWHWCTKETTASYSALIADIAPPLMVTIDGGQGTYSAITKHWPGTTIQRCTVHAARVVRRHTTSRPRTDAGKAIYRLAIQLTRIHTQQQATEWIVQLHTFGNLYRDWMNEKTLINHHNKRTSWEFTHKRVRAAYQSLLSLHRRNLLFGYLTPPPQTVEPERFVSNTNHLEGGFNAQLKLIARLHRGRNGEKQRTMIDWWLYLHTQLPGDPIRIARQQNWGYVQLAKAQAITHNEKQANHHDDGRPALYAKDIDHNYNHSMGIQHGWIR